MDNIVEDLQKYMLTETFVKTNTHRVADPVNKRAVKPKTADLNVSAKNTQYPSFFYPEQADQLFWCFYIIKNGFLMYEYPGNTSFINEKKEKFKCIEYLRENKALLKEKKIKNIKEDIEDELANKEKIGVKTFIALCIAHNIRVLFIHNRKCFDSDKDNTGKVSVVHYDNNKKYCYEHDVRCTGTGDYSAVTVVEAESLLQSTSGIDVK